MASIILFLLLVLAPLALVIARIFWVYNVQMAYIAEIYERPTAQWFSLGCPNLEDVCEGHTAMMVRFWVWDKERFRLQTLPPPNGPPYNKRPF